MTFLEGIVVTTLLSGFFTLCYIMLRIIMFVRVTEKEEEEFYEEVQKLAGNQKINYKVNKKELLK